jgi:hypothetical protein
LLKGQTFLVVCYCGETVSGSRELSHQEIACPHCGKTLFILPADQYVAKPRKASSGSAPADGAPSDTVIDKLHRLAFWTRLQESRRILGRQIGTFVRRMSQWVKQRLSSTRK